MKWDDLGVRTGLPDGLYVLLRDYPRAHWEHDPGFRGLVEFWLGRHMMFRQILTALGEKCEALLAQRMEPRRFQAEFARYAGFFVQQLHGHHQIEDLHYFPKLKLMDSQIATGFDILDRDHHALDAALRSFADVANGAIQAGDREIGELTNVAWDEVRSFEKLIERHLLDEEDLVVPVILKFGAARLH